MKVNGCLATITTRYPLSSHRYLVRISCVLVVSSLFILDDIKMFINFFPSLIVQMTKTLPNLPKHQAITIYQKVIPHHVLMFYNLKYGMYKETQIRLQDCLGVMIKTQITNQALILVVEHPGQNLWTITHILYEATSSTPDCYLFVPFLGSIASISVANGKW